VCGVGVVGCLFLQVVCVVMNQVLYRTKVRFPTSSLISCAFRCVCVVDEVAKSFSYILGLLLGIMFILLIKLQQLFGHYVSFIYEVVATF
jgi:hypothetical protein